MPQVLVAPAAAAVSHDAPAALCDNTARRPPTLKQAISEACAVRHYSRRTFDAYWHWARQFVLYAPVALAKRVPEASHVNLRGEVVRTSSVARLLTIAGGPLDDDVPF